MSALQCSVLTSSSFYPMTSLIREVAAIGGVRHFDVMLLRDTDIHEIEEEGIVTLSPARNTLDYLDKRTITRLMAESPWEGIARWIDRQFPAARVRDVRIDALATYYPEISSVSEKRRQRAIDALVNTVKIALKLHGSGLMDQPIVEIVCGQILDTCACPKCRENACVLWSTREKKYEYLLDSCRKVVQQVGKDQRFGLALELEPGETYVLNNGKAIDTILGRVRDCDALRRHVGMNMDIAHMKIAEVHIDVLKKHKDMIMHAHIADTPGVHTRDHLVGTWVAVQQGLGSYHPYLKLLAERPDGTTLRSNSVALEIEGNNRIDWIYRSLSAMKHLVATVA